MRSLLVGLFLLVFGLAGCCTKSLPAGSATMIGQSTTTNIYERYIDVHRVDLIFEFGYVPNPDEILNWERRFCEWDKSLCG